MPLTLITIAAILLMLRLSGRADDTSEDDLRALADGDERLGNVVERGGR